MCCLLDLSLLDPRILTATKKLSFFDAGFSMAIINVVEILNAYFLEQWM